MKVHAQLQLQLSQKPLSLKIEIVIIKIIIKIIIHTIKLIIKKIKYFSAALLFSTSNSVISFSFFIYSEITGLIDLIL